ncbi:MAG: DnaA/Hda family protein [Calditrichia bacterium]
MSKELAAVRLNMLEKSKDMHERTPDVRLAGSSVPSQNQPVTMEGLWAECLELIAKALPKGKSEQTLNTWFKPIHPVQFVDNILYLRIESHFFGEWLDSHYRAVLLNAVRSVFGDNARLEYQVTPGAKKKSEPEETPVTISADETSAPKPETVRKTPGAHRLDAQYRFANFFANGNNRFALKTAEHVSRNLGEQVFNPLYFHGQVGTGKTHLIHALGNNLSENYDNRRVIYLTAESFVHAYITAVQSQSINKFISAMRSVDVLLLDNFHFLAGKTKSQEALMLILQDLLHRGSQVVIGSNVPPSLLPQFNPSLVALAQGGLIADLHHTDVTTREQIVRHYLSENGIDLEEASVQYLAKNLGTNIHHMRSVVVRIVAQISLMKKALGTEDIRYIVSQLCPQSENEMLQPGTLKRAIRIPDIIKAVSGFFDVPLEMLRVFPANSGCQSPASGDLSMPRTDGRIAEAPSAIIFSSLHHASVLYAYNKTKSDITENPRLRSNIEKIRALL